MIVMRFLTFFGHFEGFLLKPLKNLKKRIIIIQMDFLLQIFMVTVDRIQNGSFFFSQKLKKSNPRLKNGGSPSPDFSFKRSTPRKCWFS